MTAVVFDTDVDYVDSVDFAEHEGLELIGDDGSRETNPRTRRPAEAHRRTWCATGANITARDPASAPIARG